MGILEAVRQGKPIPVPVIDTHVHLGECSEVGLFQPFSHGERLMQYADEIGIDVFVTAPITLTYGEMDRTNEEAAELIRQYPGRIYGNIFVSPHEGAEGVRRTIDRWSKADGFTGIKILTGYHGEPDREEFKYAWAFAQEAQCPVTIHIYGVNPSKASVLRVLQKYPDVKLVLAHQGGGHEEDTRYFAGYMQDYKLYLDTCGSLNNTMNLWEMAQVCGEDRLIYGSDITFMEPRYELGKIIFSGMPEETMKKLLAENYMNLLEGSSLTRIRLG